MHPDLHCSSEAHFRNKKSIKNLNPGSQESKTIKNSGSQKAEVGEGSWLSREGGSRGGVGCQGGQGCVRVGRDWSNRGLVHQLEILVSVTNIQEKHSAGENVWFGSWL